MVCIGFDDKNMDIVVFGELVGDDEVGSVVVNNDIVEWFFKVNSSYDV